MWREPDAMQRTAIRLDVPVLGLAKAWKAYGAALLAVGLALECTHLPHAVRSQLFLAAVVAGAISVLAAGRRRAEDRAGGRRWR